LIVGGNMKEIKEQ